MKRIPLLLLIAALAGGPGLLTAEPLHERIDLFEAGKDGYAIYRIPAITTTKKGTVLAWCEARRTGKSDWDTIDILMRRSTDGGKTWDEPRKVVHEITEHVKNPVALAKSLARPDDITWNNPAVTVDEKGTIHFLYCLEYARCFYRQSTDEGETWSDPVEITDTFAAFRPEYDWKVIATGPGHGIQMDSGRMVVPVWLSDGTGGHAHRPSAVSVIYSDDLGKTWERGEIVVRDPKLKNPSETIVVELSDGRAMLNIRSENREHRRAVSISEDGATNWSEVRFDDALLEPVCMASIVSLSGDGKDRLVFVNPHNLERRDGKEAPEKSRDRVNLTAKLSYDDGQTWPVSKVLEPGYSSYSDLTTLPDGTVLCLYEWGDNEDTKNSTRYTHLSVARFNLEWLTDGEDSYGKSE